MNDSKRNFIIVLLAASAYFALFIPINSRCAADPNMLIFSSWDESALYNATVKMALLTGPKPGSSLAEAIRQIVDHKVYYYGYPFHFVAAVSIAPVKLFSRFWPGNYTRANVLILRQLSVLFTVASIVLLVSMMTQFKTLTASLSLFVFLGAIPAVFLNCTWFRPDAMVTFFVVATLFCLNRDELRFGKWFCIAAVSCGLAVATKVMGVFFVVCIPSYLALGIVRGQITWIKASMMGLIFCVVMIVTVFAAYPLLLLDTNTASWIINNYRIHAKGIAYGYENVQMDKGLLPHYREILRDFHGLWPLYCLCLAGGIAGLLADRRRLCLNLTILTWSIPFFTYVVNAVAFKIWYYHLASLLPFTALVWNPSLWRHALKISRVATVIIAVFLAVQFSLFVDGDIKRYTELAALEDSTPAFIFYKELMAKGVLVQQSDKPLRIWYGSGLWIPYNKNQSICTERWGVAPDYSDIKDFNPDFVILARSAIQSNTAAGSGNKADTVRFYSDARDNRLKGYSRVYETWCALVFKRVEEQKGQGKVSDGEIAPAPQSAR